MKFAIVTVIPVFLLLTSCHKQCSGKNEPKCIDQRIDDFSGSCCPSGAKVKEYTFQGKIVFVFDPGNCGADMTSEVYDKECNSQGFLGGIMGNSKINGEDFSKAKYIKTIWKN